MKRHLERNHIPQSEEFPTKDEAYSKNQVNSSNSNQKRLSTEEIGVLNASIVFLILITKNFVWFGFLILFFK